MTVHFMTVFTCAHDSVLSPPTADSAEVRGAVCQGVWLLYVTISCDSVVTHEMEPSREGRAIG